MALALLYGQDDYYRTMQYAFAMGYDADCNAATAGAVLGVRLGLTGLKKIPNFTVVDKYANFTRPSLPKEVKISEQVEQMTRLAEKVILAGGGEKLARDGQTIYRIKLQSRACSNPCRRTQPPRRRGPRASNCRAAHATASASLKSWTSPWSPSSSTG